MTYKWLLFDLDGTLFDYDRAEPRALRRAFESMGVPYDESVLEHYRTLNAGLWRDFEKGLIDQARIKVRRFELLFEAIDRPYDAQAFSDNYMARLSEETVLIEGAEETLKALSGHFDLAAITNGLTDVQGPRLARSALQPYIKVVVISEEEGVNKPDPAIFDITFARLGHPARDEVLIVGDSLTSDIRGGHDYGIDTCWFNPSGRTDGDSLSTYEIRRLTDLLNVLGVG